MADDKASGTRAMIFTEPESKLLIAIMQNLTSDIQFDANTIAEQLGYKDGSIVKARWSQIKRKKLATGAAPAGGIKKRSPIKKGAAKKDGEDANAAGDDDDEGLNGGSPAQTPKKGGRKPKAQAAVKEELLEEDGFETTETAEEGEEA